MKTKIIFLLFAVASAWVSDFTHSDYYFKGDPFFYPEDQEIAPSSNWREKRNSFLHRIGTRNFHLPPLFRLKTRMDMAHPFFEQAKVLC